MDLHVKRFKVRYRGKDHGPGSVIYDVEQETAEKLIADSNGCIEALPTREAAPASVPAENENIGTAVADNEGVVALPSVDPKKTVK